MASVASPSQGMRGGAYSLLVLVVVTSLLSVTVLVLSNRFFSLR